MEFTASLLAALSIFCLLRHLHCRSSRRSMMLAAAGIPDNRGERSPAPGRILAGLRAAVTRLGVRLGDRERGELEPLLKAIGSRSSFHYFQGLRAAGGALAAAFTLFLGLPALILAPLLFAAAYRIPVFLLRRKHRLMMAQVASDLPEVVDLMAVLCYCGESLYRSLMHSTRACVHPASRAEIEAIIDRMRLGDSYAEALRQTTHHPCREMRRLGRALLRAGEHGAPVSAAMEELATELRSARRERDRVRASRGSVLILFPLVFMILPSFLLLTVGGMILGFGT